MKYRKIVVTRPDTVELKYDSKDVTIEDPKEVVIRNHYSLISAGTELACLAGLESWFPIPGTPGYVAVGEILEAGSGVDNLKTGDIVYTFGPHAEIFKVNVTDRWSGICLKIPEGLREDLSAFTRMAQIAMTSIRMSNIELGDHVAVTGLGPIGNFAAQLAQLQGAKVMGIDISEKRVEIAKACGIEKVVNSRYENPDEAIAAFTNGKGFSTYIDATGLSSVIEGFLKHVSLYGEAILLGSPRAPYETNLTETLQRVHLWTHGSITLKGALEFRYPTHETEFRKHSTERNSRIIMELIRDGKLKIEPFYTHRVKPENAQEVYDGLRNLKDTFIGVIFDWTL